MMMKMGGGGKKSKFTDRGELERPIGDRPTPEGVFARYLHSVCPVCFWLYSFRLSIERPIDEKRGGEGGREKKDVCAHLESLQLVIIFDRPSPPLSSFVSIREAGGASTRGTPSKASRNGDVFN